MKNNPRFEYEQGKDWGKTSSASTKTPLWSEISIIWHHCKISNINPKNKCSLAQTRRLTVPGTTCFSCSKAHYLVWWLHAIEICHLSDISAWFSCSSLISLIDFPLQLPNKPTSPKLSWKCSEGSYASARRTLYKGYSLLQIQMAEQLASYLLNNCKAWHITSTSIIKFALTSNCPVNDKSSRGNSWTKQMPVKPVPEPASSKVQTLTG